MRLKKKVELLTLESERTAFEKYSMITGQR